MTGLLLALRALPEAARWGVLLAAIGGAGGGLTWVHHKIYQEGYDAAIAAVAADNKEAIDAANTARERVRACNALDGMRWDQVAGECVARGV